MLKNMSAKRPLSLPSFEPIPLDSGIMSMSGREVAETALDILSQTDDVVFDGLDAASAIIDVEAEKGFFDSPSLEPVPIGPNGIDVVEQVQLSSAPWQGDESFAKSLHNLLATAHITKVEPTSSSNGLAIQIPSSFSTKVTHLTSASDDEESSNEPCSATGDASSKSGGSSIRPTQSEQWNQRLGDLINFRNEFGHCLVPLNWKRNPSLAHWVKRQRYQYNLKLEGKHSTMTRQREIALENLGFVWDSHAAAWEERWNELRAFRELYHHCNVPTKYPENPQLSVWVKCQRRQFKLLRSGKKSTMTRQRITRLLHLGFVFDPRRAQKVDRSSFV